MSVSVLWFQIVSEVMVNLSAAAIVSAIANAIRPQGLVPEKRALIVTTNAVAALLALLSVFGLRTLVP